MIIVSAYLLPAPKIPEKRIFAFYAGSILLMLGGMALDAETAIEQLFKQSMKGGHTLVIGLELLVLSGSISHIVIISGFAQLTLPILALFVLLAIRRYTEIIQGGW